MHVFYTEKLYFIFSNIVFFCFLLTSVIIFEENLTWLHDH